MVEEHGRKPAKKFINNYQEVVPDALDGLCMTNPAIRRIEGTQIITLKAPRKCVNVICGGGSGHEPAHAGYVCDGILSAAVCGGVFASPSYQDVLRAILQVENEKGVLVVVKNYTGDCINFELAADVARTKGVNVMTLHVADDISLEEEQGVGRRGLAGTVMLYKILGAAANDLPLKELHQLGTRVLKKMFTIGASFSACSIPGYPPMYTLPEDEMEIGLGIHGEKGLKRVKALTCDQLMDELVHCKFAKLIPKGKEVVVLLNNLGSCTELEMMVLVKSLMKKTTEAEITVRRIIHGRIMTSLEMHGMSLTLLELEDENKDYVLKCLDAPVECKHWNISAPNKELSVPQRQATKEKFSAHEPVKLAPKAEALKRLLHHVFSTLRFKDSYYNQLDAEVGDGDLGIGVAKTSELVLKSLDYLPLESDLVGSLEAMGELMAQGFGGTTGPLYAFFLLKGSHKLHRKLADNSAHDWWAAMSEGISAIQHIGKANLGDRTMLDAMSFAVKKFEEEIGRKTAVSASEIAKEVAKAARKGADAAAGMTAKRGRSSYLKGKEVGKREPGCELFADWVQLVVDKVAEL